ncbi:MAG TPA: hypothetical protein VGN17_13105 [Bryobacteraceae bacterium]
MANKVKVLYEGDTVEADELQFSPVVVTRGEYMIEGGGVIEIRHEVKSIYRLCEKAKADGSPIYLITGGAAVQVRLPEMPPANPVLQAEQQIKS